MDKPQEDRLLLRPAEASELLGIGRARLYQLIATRAIPVVRVGHRYRVPVRALHEWIERQVVSPTAATPGGGNEEPGR